MSFHFYCFHLYLILIVFSDLCDSSFHWTLYQILEFPRLILCSSGICFLNTRFRLLCFFYCHVVQLHVLDTVSWFGHKEWFDDQIFNPVTAKLYHHYNRKLESHLCIVICWYFLYFLVWMYGVRVISVYIQMRKYRKCRWITISLQLFNSKCKC